MRGAAARDRAYDYLIVGGGLHGALIAFSVLEQRAGARLALIERAPALGGNHVWCFHAGDVSEAAAQRFAPLVERSWSGYDVSFDGFERRVDSAYSAVSSQRLDRVVRGAFARRPDCSLLLETGVRRLFEHGIELEDGRQLRGEVVIRATGPEPGLFARRPAFQKFVGLELELAAPCARELPLLMDARVPQRDGYRFFYVLPFSSRRVLIEDTYFSATPELDPEQLRHEILGYAHRSGYSPARVLRSEIGVLPLPLDSGPVRRPPGPLAAGYGGGFFHPTTGYSFPLAARVAELVAATSPHELLARAWDSLRARHRRQFRFCVLLNRLLYGAFAPEHRQHVFRRFYGLPEPVLARFYAMTMTASDRARVFCGTPPPGFSLRLALAGGNPR